MKHEAYKAALKTEFEYISRRLDLERANLQIVTDSVEYFENQLKALQTIMTRVEIGGDSAFYHEGD